MEKGRSKTKQIISGFFLGTILLLAACSGRTSLSALDHAVEGRRSADAVGEFETALNASFPAKNAFVDLNGLFRRLLLQREMNGVVRLKNGFEAELMEAKPEEGIEANANSIKEFSDWLGDRGIDMFFCYVPTKLLPGDDQLPGGLADGSNETADSFLSKLRDRGVEFLDLRQSMEDDGVDVFSLFLRTEHHWSPYGGFYAFTKICSFLEEEWGYAIDPKTLDLDNYYQETFKNGSLGYYGQRTGFLFAGFDDFTLIYPKFETRQTCRIPHKDILRSGGFYDTIFDMDKFAVPWRERGLYPSYIGGDYPLVIHHSETAENSKTVMIFIDSFGTVTESYLTTVFQNVVAVDLRWVRRTGMDQSAADLVREFDPDAVIVMFNPSLLGAAEGDQFLYGIE